MMPSNFLLLDEPTNHLDMRAKDVLLTALQAFTGTVVFVSHDRYFIDRLATRIFEVDDGRVTIYPGNYEDYLWRKSGCGSGAAAEEVRETEVRPAASNGGARVAADPQGKRLNPIKLRQMQERRTGIEDEVTKLEAEIADYETALSNFVNVEETTRNSALLDQRRADLERLMQEWEEVVQAIEANS